MEDSRVLYTLSGKSFPGVIEGLRNVIPQGLDRVVIPPATGAVTPPRLQLQPAPTPTPTYLSRSITNALTYPKPLSGPTTLLHRH